jgi:hypothetical protein
MGKGRCLLDPYLSLMCHVLFEMQIGNTCDNLKKACECSSKWFNRYLVKPLVSALLQGVEHAPSAVLCWGCRVQQERYSSLHILLLGMMI